MSQSLFDNLPPRPLTSQLCHPAYCSGITRTVTPAQLEATLLDFFQKTRINMLMRICFQDEPKLVECLVRLAGAVLDSKLDSVRNQAAVETYLKDSSNLFQDFFSKIARFEYRMFWNLLGNQSSMLKAMTDSACFCWTTESLLDVQDILGSGRLDHVLNYPNKEETREKFEKTFIKNGWAAEELQVFMIELAIKTSAMMGSRLITSEFNKLFVISEVLYGGVGIMRLGSLLLEMNESAAPEEPLTVPFHPGSLVSLAEIASVALIPGWLAFAGVKEKADSLAKEDQLSEALRYYVSVYTLSHEPELRLFALANSAAVRLRLQSEEPKLIPMIILETTLALEIDPNYVKALFRRGLALAILKHWKAAILDFERALDLDPYSPAKAELVEARKQFALLSSS